MTYPITYNHLDPIQVGEDIQMFQLIMEPGSNMNSTDILFTHRGIVIMGDLCPGHNGMISDSRYGLEWFTKELSPDYLCSKFFQKTFDRKVALDQLKELENEWEMYDDVDEESLISLSILIDDFEAGLIGVESVYDELGDDLSENFGMYYDPQDKHILTSIQKEFRRLYLKLS